MASDRVDQPGQLLALPTISDFSPEIVGDLAVLMKKLSSTPNLGRTGVLSRTLETCYPHLDRKRLGNISGTLKSFDLLARDPIALTELGLEIASLHDGDVTGLGGRGVLDVATNAERAKAAAGLVSKHLLLHRNGLKLLEAIAIMNGRKEPITKISMASTLKSMGISGLANGTTKQMALTNWFAKAGIVRKEGKNIEVDDAVLASITGVKVSDIDVLSALNPAQRMFMGCFKVRAQVDSLVYIPASLVYDECKRNSYALFNKLQDKIHKELIEPLLSGGWLEIETRTSVGRGGTGARIRATAKLLGLPLESVLNQLSPDLSIALRVAQRTPLSDIRAMLVDTSRDVRGRGLEMLALRMVVDLGLEPRGFRLISQDTTGGTEVDLLAEGTHLTFTRWSIQCKCHAHETFKENTVVKNPANDQTAGPVVFGRSNTVGASTVAKEVGVAVVSQAHVIMLVTTSKFTKDAYDYAVAASDKTMLQFIFVDGDLVNRYLLKDGAVALTDYILETTRRTMQRRRLPWNYEPILSRIEPLDRDTINVEQTIP